MLILIEEAASLISFVLIMILFWWTFLAFQNSTTSIASGHKLKYLCLLSLLSFFLMSFISAFLMTNLVTQHLTLGMCQIIYPLYFAFYNIGKVSTYCLVSFRQQLIFNQDLYSQQNLAISPITSNVYRLFCIFIPSMLWSVLVFLGYKHIEIITVSNPGENNDDYKYCYMKTFDYVFFAQIILALLGVVDTLFRFITLSMFITKSIKVTMYYKQNLNTQKRDIITKLGKLMRKANLLDTSAIFCTLSFLICSAYIFQQLIFFLVIDAVICSCCTIALFQFGNKLYVTTCLRCEPYCVCLYCLEKNLQRRNNKQDLVINGFVDEDLVIKSSVHLKATPSTPDCIYNSNNTTPITYASNPQTTGLNTYESTDTRRRLNLQEISECQRLERKSTVTAVTMLSGYENVEPKDLEIASDRLVDDRYTSLLSVSEFL